MHVRLLTQADAPAFFALRVEALEREPHAFSATPEAEHASSPEERAALLHWEPEGNFVIGAFTNETLVGMVGLTRHLLPKVQHKAVVQGLYVRATMRGQGTGRALVTELIARTRTYSGLEQLTLWVSTTQQGAQMLYGNLGFEPFGLERRALKIDNTYVDNEYMVLWLKA